MPVLNFKLLNKQNRFLFFNKIPYIESFLDYTFCTIAKYSNRELKVAASLGLRGGGGIFYYD